MPPRTTWTSCSSTSFAAAASAALVVGGAVFDEQLERAAEQAAAGVDVVDDHLGDVRVGDAHERERAGLIGDHADLDGVG